jgi:hypothetical protein
LSWWINKLTKVFKESIKFFFFSFNISLTKLAQNPDDPPDESKFLNNAQTASGNYGKKLEKSKTNLQLIIIISLKPNRISLEVHMYVYSTRQKKESSTLLFFSFLLRRWKIILLILSVCERRVSFPQNKS